MGEGVNSCRTESVYLLVTVVVKGSIGDEDYALVVTFCLAACYHVGIVPGDAIASLNGCLAAI